MSRMELKGDDCNVCVTYRCRKVNSEFPRMRMKYKLSAKELGQMNCTGFKEPLPWKIPMLVQLATNKQKVQALNDLLTKFGIQLQERKSYPYFRLFIKKARKQHGQYKSN